ncbi:hypothetical protein STEG23_007993 [Scotinomys teguina]
MEKQRKKNGRGRLVDVPQDMGVIDVQLEKTKSQAMKTLEKKGSEQAHTGSSVHTADQEAAHSSSRLVLAFWDSSIPNASTEEIGTKKLY